MSISKRWWAASIAATCLFSSAFTVGILRLEHVDFSQGTSGLTSLSKLSTAYQTLMTGYFQKQSSTTLENGAIAGMVKSLNDPFTDYMAPTEAKAFTEQINSSFQGIGAVMEENNGVIDIVSVLKDSPAEKAMLKKGDVIDKVNGKSVKGMTLEAVQQLVRGPSGTAVTLDMYRPNTKMTLHFKVVRAQINEQTVTADYDHGHRTGFIQIAQFSEPTAKEFESHLADLEASAKKDGGPLRGLVIDLRQNPGGLLDSVQQIASDLLPKGKLIVQVAYGNNKTYQIRSDKSGLGIPIVCIIDGGSASAAEILAGAIRDSGHGALVGEKSFGKGTVQETKSFPDGSSLKYTIAKWLTPDGSWIHKIGLKPNAPVSLPDYDKLPTLNPSTTLQYDMNNTDVQVLQKTLIALGYHPDRTDGYFSQKTVDAVQQFQRDQHLTPSGAMDQPTALRLNQQLSTKIKANDTQRAAAEAQLQQEIATTAR